MAMEQGKKTSPLDYMELDDFVNAKKENESLKPYSSLVNFNNSCFKLSLSKEELENLKK